MSTTTRRTARTLAVVAAVPAAVALSLGPASAAPDPGAPVGDPSPGVLWGWPSGDGPDYPGQRFGIGLPPELRGPVLEFLHG